MPLFRLLRDGLAESLSTTVVVKNLAYLCAVIADHAAPNANWGAKVEIEPYPSEGNNFDPRIGWYTHIVTANLYEQNKMDIVGFLSEPLE